MNNNSYIKIEKDESFVREKDTGAVLNVDNNALYQYKQNRNKMLQREEKIEQMEKDISEIKLMLKEILEK